MNGRRSALAAVLAAGLALGPLAARALAQGCAMCGTATSPDDPLSRAISWSVLFLIAMPYTVCGIVGGWFYWSYRRAGARRRAQVVPLARAGHPTDPLSPKEA